LGEVAALGFTCLASLVMAAIMIKLWTVPDLHAPMVAEGDVPFVLSSFKGIHDFGWIWSNSSLGAPFGEKMYDFGSLGPDNLHWAMAWVLARFTGYPGAIYNGILLVSFPMSAAAAYAVLRWLNISRLASIVPAALFAVAPYHVLRGLVGHLLLAESMAIPFGVFLAMAIATGVPLWRRRERESPGVLRWATWTSGRTVILCLVIASCGIYYAVFTILFVVAAALAMRFARPDGNTAALSAVAVLALLGGMLVFNVAPSILYHQAHGSNAVVGQRGPNESLTYGLNLIGQILPPATHRLHAFASLGNRWWSETNLPSEGPTWGGTVSTLGLVLLVGSLLATLVGSSERRWLLEPRLRAAALVVVVAAFFGATGAGGTIIAFVVNPSLRGWNRIGIVLVFCSLVAIAVALDTIGRHSRTRGRRGTIAFVAVIPALLAFGTWDQSWPSMHPDYKTQRAYWSSDAHFVEKISASLNGRGEIYQLPYLAFPESPPINNMADYSPLKGYLHSGPGLKWSYGAMKGRPEDWQAKASEMPLATQVPAVALAGFDGLWIDTNGYVNPNAEALDPLRKIIGADPTFRSDDNARLVYYDLRPLRARLQRHLSPTAARSVEPLLTHPLTTAFGSGFYPVETDPKDAATNWRWATSTAAVKIVNSMKAARTVQLDARLSAGRRAAVKLTLDGRPVATTFAAGGKGHKISLNLQVPAGVHTLSLSTSAPRTTPSPGDARDLRLQVFNFVLEDQVLDQIAG
jgi:phosphoglycerol transferase